MKKILEKTLKKIVPTSAEIREEKRIARELAEKIRKTKGKHVFVQLLGSLARNTHLRGDRDLDIFVFFPKKLSAKEFEKEGLRIGKKVLKGHFWEEAFSEHPYIRGNYRGFEVEIVPAYHIKGVHEKKSSVDRTPFHYEYLQKKLLSKQKNQVRLLKQFLKGIQAYGADAHYNSLPGYATELLIVRYKTFWQCLKAIAKWKPPTSIDLNKHWQKKALLQKFPDAALIVVDPTDPNRNVAAALSQPQLQRIIHAAQAFLKKPSFLFFFPKPTKPWSISKIQQKAKEKKLVGLRVSYPPKAINDIIWGQIKKLAKKTRLFLEQNDFVVKRIESFTDEKKLIIVLAELKSLALPKTKLRQGPFVLDETNVKRFLNAHPKCKPRIQKKRVVLQTKRKIVSAQKALQRFSKEIQQTEKQPLRKTLKQRKSILDATNIGKHAKKNRVLRKFVSDFLRSPPKF